MTTPRIGMGADSTVDRIGTAVVGLGRVATAHTEALATLPTSRLVAVYDEDPARTHAFAARYGVQPARDFDAILSNRDVQMVSICTPHTTHARLSLAALSAGVNVLVEKPMALDLVDCDQMIASASSRRVKLGVVSQRRWYEPVRRVKDAIQSGRIGQPALATLTVLGWRSAEYYTLDPWRGTWAGEGGGVLVTQVTHHLDLLQWLVGPVDQLEGYWSNFNHPTIEVEDSAVAAVRFRGGALGSIVVSNSVNPGLYGQIHIHGTTGATVGVQTDGGSPFISGVTTEVEPPFNDLWTIPGEEAQLARWQTEDREQFRAIDLMTYYHRLQIADFLEAIIDDRAPLVTGEDGRASVELFTAIYRSERDGQPVPFPVPRFTVS